MINREKILSNGIRKTVILFESNDFNVDRKGEAIWKTFRSREIRKNCEPIMVIYPDGHSEVFRSKAKTQKECKIGYVTLQKCIDTGQPDQLGRCYDYVIL